jgi:hypothetical protein
MLIVRSPVRISFAGGGTDLPTPGIGAKARAKSPGEWKPPHRAGAMKHKCPGLIQLDILEILSVTGLQLLKNRSHSLSPDRVPVPVHKLPFAHKSYEESLLLQHLTPSRVAPFVLLCIQLVCIRSEKDDSRYIQGSRVQTCATRDMPHFRSGSYLGISLVAQTASQRYGCL